MKARYAISFLLIGCSVFSCNKKDDEKKVYKAVYTLASDKEVPRKFIYKDKDGTVDTATFPGLFWELTLERDQPFTAGSLYLKCPNGVQSDRISGSITVDGVAVAQETCTDWLCGIEINN